ncbi:MAG: cytochrome c [Gemmatimonadetes bacterium]|nr:cytochrome c [Gemmatimonadota bacterium]
MKKTVFYSALMFVLAGCASTGAPAGGAAPTSDLAAPEASSASAFYTSQQASRGDGLFRDNCVSCHSSSEFMGASFERRWRNRAVGDIYEFVLYAMPDDNPGGLPEQTYADIVAYMLQMNDFPAGGSELPTSLETLMQMKMFADGGDR